MISAEKQHTMDLLRDALRTSLGDPVLDAAANRSLLFGVVDNDPDLRQVWFEEAGPKQVELDLHLEGVGVDGHSTNANSFAVFVSRISDAVKETAKSLAGKERYTPELLIDALRPGSVAVTLRAPDPKAPAKSSKSVPEDSFEGMDSSTIDSQALRRIAQVMTLASDEDTLENEALLAAVEQLPLKAKRSLRTAVGEARKAAWEIDGTIAERHRGIDEVRLTPRGAAKLAEALSASNVEKKPEEAFGTIDGLKYSLGVMWFQPEAGSGRSFAAAVREDKMLSRVAELAAEHHRVKASFDTFRTFADGSAAPIKVSRVLRSIVNVTLEESDQPELDLKVRENDIE